MKNYFIYYNRIKFKKIINIIYYLLVVVNKLLPGTGRYIIG